VSASYTNWIQIGAAVGRPDFMLFVGDTEESPDRSDGRDDILDRPVSMGPRGISRTPLRSDSSEMPLITKKSVTTSAVIFG
jgi:hypothetical protein